MKKQERIREIIEHLIRSGKFNRYQKRDIEKSIIICRQPLDERTINNWFNLLWTLEYVVQPECGVYSLNLEMLVDLEIKFPDTQQRKLSNV